MPRGSPLRVAAAAARSSATVVPRWLPLAAKLHHLPPDVFEHRFLHLGALITLPTLLWVLRWPAELPGGRNASSTRLPLRCCFVLSAARLQSLLKPRCAMGAVARSEAERATYGRQRVLAPSIRMHMLVPSPQCSAN